jgi:flavin reductase (DIM6/NTAB) family NADH-FMN oxidoreductase RutF
VLVAIAKHHHTWQLVEGSSALALHLIDEKRLDLVWRFGTTSGRDADKFTNLSVRQGATGSPLIQDTLAWLDCRVEARFDTGDRTAFLCEIVDVQHNRHEPPLTMHRLLQLAPPDKLQELRRQREQDSALDAAAILAWRGQHRG